MSDDLYIGGRTGAVPLAPVMFDSAGLTSDDLAELEQRLADELADIDVRWREVAAAVEEVTVGLERDDIDVTDVVLVWIRRDA
jgi:hypothetical protein